MPINYSVIILGRIIKHIKKAIISQRFKVTSNSPETLFSLKFCASTWSYSTSHFDFKSYYEHNVVENENIIGTLFIDLHK